MTDTNPVKVFLVDLIDAAITGAVVAAVALPEGVTDARAALAFIAVAAITAVRNRARGRIADWVAKKPA